MDSSVIRKYSTGKKESVLYYYQGKLHNYTEKPSIITYHPNISVNLFSQEDNEHSKRKISLSNHRFDSVYIEHYFLEGKQHSYNDNPSYREYDINGNLLLLKYYNQNLMHRDSNKGPAWITYNTNGTVSREEYYEDDKTHRLDGPAVIIYDDQNKVELEEYWIDNKIVRRLILSEKGWDIFKCKVELHYDEETNIIKIINL